MGLPAATIAAGMGLFGQVDWTAWRWVAPAVRVSGMMIVPRSSDVGDSNGAATFTANFMLRFEACPFRFGGARANVRLCGFTSVAWIDSAGRKTELPQSEVRAMATLGGSALFSLHIVGPLEASLGGGLGGAVRRYEYAFRAHDPSQQASVLYETPKTGGFAALALGAELP